MQTELREEQTMQVQEEEITVPIVAPDYQTLEGIQKHPLFTLLTGKQQVFVVEYIRSGGDRLKAEKVAYNSKKPAVTAMRCLRTAYVRKLIAVYYGYEQDLTPMGKQEMLGLIAARLRRPSLPDKEFRSLAGMWLLLKAGNKRQSAVKSSLKRGVVEAGVAIEEEDYADEAVNLDALVAQIEAERKK
jgi:hypothetical protein